MSAMRAERIAVHLRERRAEGNAARSGGVGSPPRLRGCLPQLRGSLPRLRGSLPSLGRWLLRGISARLRAISADGYPAPSEGNPSLPALRPCWLRAMPSLAEGDHPCPLRGDALPG